ncbi:hypothetical protein RvY_08225 [Ramazzottius varieornatus]|uniref:Uncharacterized protein n=1 Tax=Ramazzottius varieornatus TaxID=947166 RepID=A0A1D1VAT3_RAMVA|nr:hypothetical protein RvY_08225 [Ramazzottius varieornatus]
MDQGSVKDSMEHLSVSDYSTGASGRRHSHSAADRRGSLLMPESPYASSDETRARGDLLDQDSALRQGRSYSLSKATNMSQCIGSVSDMMSDLSGIIAGAGLLSSSPTSSRASVDLSAESRLRTDSLGLPGYDTSRRRSSFTPESPYMVSDETRARKENLEEQIVVYGQFAVDRRRSSAGHKNAEK